MKDKFEILEEFANAKLKEWSPKTNGWKFCWDKRPVRRYGQCRYNRREIGLSVKLVEVNTIERSKDTILHEIAHILAGRGNAHNKIWKLYAVEVGATPRARYRDINHGGETVCIEREKAKYILINQDTGEIYRKYFRRPKYFGWLGSKCFIRGNKEATLGKLVVKEISL
tara:strand:- start:104 stop:610 length:507 start_codon:yes stop_codon:yes gene_type:complete